MCDIYDFLNKVFDKNLMTKFLINIFDYDDLKDYNYISRVSENNESVILDVYDNITKNRFNRYCFNFDREGEYVFNEEYDNIFITNINVLNTEDSDNKLIKFAYLFKLSYEDRIRYAETFLDKEFISILKNNSI